MIQTWALSANTGSSNKVRVRPASGRHAAARRSGRHGGFHLLAVARALFFLLAFAILFCGFVLLRSYASTDGASPATTAESVIYADTGDTLWSLADSLKKPSMDTRHAVQLLMARNQLNDSSLRAGQPLIVPAELLPR